MKQYSYIMDTQVIERVYQHLDHQVVVQEEDFCPYA